MTTDASTDYDRPTAARRHGYEDTVARTVGSADYDRGLQPEREREAMVDVHRERVSDAVKALFEQVGQMERRLAPVLVAAEPIGGPMDIVADQAPTHSLIAGHLDGFANDLNLIHRQLRDLIRRLDI